MKMDIQKKFFAWIVLQTLISFLTLGAVVHGYNLLEELEHEDGEVFEFLEELSGEAEESVIFIGTLIFMLPINIISAWFISKRLLRPWRNLNDQADKISTGELEERIQIINPEDEIGKISTSLNTAFDRYQELIEQVRRISFDISHQLRNPLAAIQTSGEVCLKDRRTPEEYEETIGDVLESTRRLRRTTDQLLMLARSASAPPLDQMDKIALQDLIEVVMKEAEMIGAVREIHVSLETPEESIYVRGIAELLQTALSNLVDNALRHSPDSGSIIINLFKPTENTARISVQDEGSGLTAEQQKNLFQPLKRNSDAHKESTGLGLPIVSDICKAHNGIVGFENLQPHGCLFWIELPSVATS